jgi:anaerobic magnesium-protoporphyrin IX monomethyl ester cyclase
MQGSSLKVALVFPYFRTHARTEILFPPLGAASLTSQLRRLGLDSRVFDGTFSTHERILEALTSYHPQIVGIYAMITLTRNALALAEAIRARLPDCLLVAGGPMPTLYPQRYTSLFEAVFRGEADLSFPRFCRDFLDRGVSRHSLRDLPLDSYEGLTVKSAQAEVDNPAVHHAESTLRAFPLPDRSDFDHRAYQASWLEKSEPTTASIITTFGCPFDCEFCSKPVFGQLFRRRDLDVVFEEVRLLRALGYDSLWIADDNFTLDPRHLEEFCRRITPAGVAWSCLSRASGVKDAMALQMKEAGCRKVYLGLESGAEDTLRLMDKRVTVQEGAEAVERYHAAGIEVAAFFIVGYPGENAGSIEATLKLALDLPLDEISFNVPFPLPGSRLFDRVVGVDEAKDWTYENEVAFVYPSEFDEAWLRRRIDETVEAFTQRKDGGSEP